MSSIDDITCRDCGRPIGRHGRTGQLIHRSGGAIAACDLDADHPPQPNWEGVDALLCARCGLPITPVGSRLTHGDPSRDADHAAWPWP